MEFDPPFDSAYKSLLDAMDPKGCPALEVEQCGLPLIDLARLDLDDAAAREKCKREIASASAEWGFFQLVNHGLPGELLERIHRVQVDVFRQPFEKKAHERLMDYSPDSYRWGNPCATSLRQLSWSEAYHISTIPCPEAEKANTIRCTIDEYTTAVSRLARRLAEILAEHLGCGGSHFDESCTSSTCYLRLNHYLPCASPVGVFGLIPHTDSAFLTVLYQDEVGGLQLMKGERWVAVKPIRGSLVVNIGDLFEVVYTLCCTALSNGEFKSVLHRVVANPEVERFSVAYFLCPSYETVIESCREPAVYRAFSFREYRLQVQEDVKAEGYKIGLRRFFT
ncbi:hypothetical protein Taro_044121 [Colocasia esculenta]|uniref:Fe2OG dioxygenase domain-containing protein n=1 Tax=Colocasia esculenta TaxID=4460 RepID=A0A843X230_COLES|nr:hypothetical protein [Colocasia esculenta]